MAVLLAPGFMLDADMWRNMETVLAPLGTLLHVDTSLDGSVEAMAARALINAPPSFIMIGFSMGGYIAREIARQAPGQVRGLVQIATSAQPDTPETVHRRIVQAEKIGQATFAGFSRAAVKPSLHPEHASDNDLIERIQAMSRRLGGDVFRRQSHMSRHGDLDHLGSIRCPTLILAGERDALRSRAEAEELQANIPNSVLQIIEETGHMVPMEAPQRTAKKILSWSQTL